MKDRSRTKTKLLEENASLRKRIQELEQAGIAQNQDVESILLSEDHYRIMAHSFPDIIYSLDSNGNVTTVNSSAFERYGYTEQDVKGKPFLEFIHPEDREILINSFLKALEDKRNVTTGLQFRIVSKNGNNYWFELNAHSHFESDGRYYGESGVLRDITERKQAEESLKESENRYKNLVENSFSCVYVIQDGRFVFSNNNAATFTGYNREEIIGKPSDSFVQQEDRGKIREKAKKMLRGEDLSPYEFKIVSKTGQLRWILETVSPISYNGHPAILGNCIDITERRKREILNLHSQKLESVGQLAAGIAHEINTPIQFIGDNITFMKGAFQGIIALAALLDAVKSDDLLNPEFAKDICARIQEKEDEIDLDFLKKEVPQAIDQSLDGLKRVALIVQAMREFSHPGGENKTDMDINKAIESTITLTRNEWKYSAELTTNLAPDLPIVQGYPADFNQVILNVIINAAHALQEKDGKGGPQKERIEISTRQDGKEVEICIRDTGAGIPQEIQSRIFDPFFTTKEVGKGTGQGLSIARNIIVKKHGGKIFFETKPGEGTAFYIRLPLIQ